MRRIELLPFFKVCIFWLAGIFTYRFFPSVDSSWALFTAAFGAFISTIFLFLPKLLKPGQQWLKTVPIMLLLLSVSYYNCRVKDPHNQAQHLLNSLYGATQLLATITEAPLGHTRGTSRYQLSVEAIEKQGKWQPAEGIVLCYTASPIDYQSCVGRHILLPAQSVRRLQKPTNPNQFDYATYMANKGVYFQCYLPDGTFALITQAPPTTFSSLLHTVRKKLLANLAFLSPQTRSVAEALLLGYKENIDAETRDAFSKTGTMHILAVSGLHVGIIYMVLLFLLDRLFKWRKLLFVKVVLLLLGLWSYAFLTGLPPSVLRATIMFSIMAIGANMLRPNNVFNNVLLSAFMLMVYNPNLVYDLSFQLSYSAVLGIILLEPRLSQFWFIPEKSWPITASKKSKFRVLINNVRYYIVRYIRGIMAVSVAAQIATLPITLYYFHQLPLLFPISNLVAIPGAFLVVTLGGTTELFMRFLPAIGHFFQWGLQGVLNLLVDSISFISEFPWVNLHHLFIHWWDVALLYLSVCSFILVLNNRNKKALWFLLLFIFCQQAISFSLHLSKNNGQLVVFDTAYASTYGLRKNNETLLICSDSSTAGVQYQTSGWLMKTTSCDTLFLKKSCTSASRHLVANKAFAIAGNNVFAFDPAIDSSLATLYILSKEHLGAALKKLPPASCVFDASVNPDWILEKYPNFAHAHFVQRDGAFVRELRN
ncbi:DUF4131 domain-containing protein [bacterium]|nr:DUF4131 domain-containing protein [bacterium]